MSIAAGLVTMYHHVPFAVAQIHDTVSLRHLTSSWQAHDPGPCNIISGAKGSSYLQAILVVMSVLAGRHTAENLVVLSGFCNSNFA